jgi:hypothetical protein
MEREFDGKRARYTHEMPVDAYTGDAVCLEIKIHRWGLILPEHLEDACKRANIKPEELKGMVVCLNTGMHRKFDDSKEYYHYTCGTGVEAGKWFVKHQVKCVAMDMQALDHPLHTAMGKNGPPQMNLPGASGKPITEEYAEQFGEEAYAEFEKAAYIKGTLPQTDAGSRHCWRREPRRRLGQGVRQALPVLLLSDPMVHGRRRDGPLRGRD